VSARQNQTELPVPPRDSAPAQAIQFSSLLQRDYCEKMRTYLVFFTLRSGNWPLRLAILTSTDRSCFPAFIILIHYIWFSGVAFPGESKALSADKQLSLLKQFLSAFKSFRAIAAFSRISLLRVSNNFLTDGRQAS